MDFWLYFRSQHEIEIHSIYFFNTHSLSYSEWLILFQRKYFVFIIFYQNVKTPVTCKNHKSLFSVLPCTVHFLKFSQFLTDKIKSHTTVLFFFFFFFKYLVLHVLHYRSKMGCMWHFMLTFHFFQIKFPLCYSHINIDIDSFKLDS